MHNDTLLEKQVFVLNESFINFFKRTSFVVGAHHQELASSTICQICRASDHIAITCSRIGVLHSSDILSIRFKHTRILRIFGLLKKYLKILYTKANFQAFVFL